MDYRLFNMGTDVNACDCTPGCMDTIRESALKIDWEKKSLAAPGNRTCVVGVPVRRTTNRATPVDNHMECEQKEGTEKLNPFPDIRT